MNAACADVAQELNDIGIEALRTSWLKSGDVPEDALGQLGTERRLARYPGEASAVYEERLYRAWEAYQRAGTAGAIVGQIEGFGVVPTQPTLTQLSPFNALASNALSDWMASLVTTSFSPTVLSPNGKPALVLRETVTSGSHHLHCVGLHPVDTAAMLSVTVKADGRSWLRLEAYQSGGPTVIRAWVNLSTGVIGSTTPANQHLEVERLGGGWYRCRLGFNTGSIGRWGARVCTATADSSTTNAGDITRGLLLESDSVRFGSWPVTVYTERQGNRGFTTHPLTTTPWWSKFWIYIDRETHQGALTSEQRQALAAIVRKWRSSRWFCEGIILGGPGPTVDIAAHTDNGLLVSPGSDDRIVV